MIDESTAYDETIIVTNNSRILKNCSNAIGIDGDAVDVMLKARDMIHGGHILISCPIGASIKMIHSPIVSIVISKHSGPVDLYSLEVLETSILKTKKIMEKREFNDVHRHDYAVIDESRLMAAFDEMSRFSGKF